MGHGAGRGKIGLAPFRVRGHRPRQAVEFGEIADPEVFVDVDVTMVALGGAAVGGQEAQFGPGFAVLAQDDGVAAQGDAEPLGGEGDDVAAENLGLGTAGGQEHLVVAGQHRVHECFGSKVVGQPDLPRLQDVADPRRERILLRGEQLHLIAEHLRGELLQEVDFGHAGDVILQLFGLAFALSWRTLTALPAALGAGFRCGLACR